MKYIYFLLIASVVVSGLLGFLLFSLVYSFAKQPFAGSILGLLAQAMFLSFALVLIIKWLILKPLVSITESLKRARSGNLPEELDEVKKHEFFRPLAKEIMQFANSLFAARTAAIQEARLRFEKLDTAWTEDRLKEYVKTYLKDRKIFMVSNREPYMNKKENGAITFSVPASGMVTAIEPIMEACGGMWLAHGSGPADKEASDKDGKIGVPPDEPKYILKRIWLSPEEEKGYYVGFSNEALWPLCHNVHTKPVFRKEDWDEYRSVNSKFAQSLLLEIKDAPNPLIMVQDYHLALLPQLVKKTRPDAQIILFWHIPWPGAETFGICPWAKEILEGLLASDVIGFHTQQYCNNFMDTAGREIESVINLEEFSITHDAHTTFVRPLPISVDFTGENNMKKDAESEKLLKRYGIKTQYLGIGADRLDYTKGIVERFRGIESFLEEYPSYMEKFSFLQIAPPSREGSEVYRQFAKEVLQEADRINSKFYANGWRPIIFANENLSHEELFPLYRLADFCLVTSLHDGMNLVAKEFVASRNDLQGTLILSEFTGSSRSLKDAIIVNPYNAHQISMAIFQALTMPKMEQRKRMKKMRQSLKEYNIYRWAAELIKSAMDV